jgi:hypothetical protein
LKHGTRDLPIVSTVSKRAQGYLDESVKKSRGQAARAASVKGDREKPGAGGGSDTQNYKHPSRISLGTCWNGIIVREGFPREFPRREGDPCSPRTEQFPFPQMPKGGGILAACAGLAIATVAIPADLIGERLAKNAPESTPNVANRAEFVQVTVALPGGVSATTKESLS